MLRRFPLLILALEANGLFSSSSSLVMGSLLLPTTLATEEEEDFNGSIPSLPLLREKEILSLLSLENYGCAHMKNLEILLLCSAALVGNS